MEMRILQWLCLWCLCFVGLMKAQISPFQRMQLASMLQQRNNLLQQTLLQNLINQANIQGTTRGSNQGTTEGSNQGTTRGSNPTVALVRQLAENVNRMTQTMMSNLNVGAQPGLSTPGANFVPVDEFLRQQRNLQTQILQNVQNTQTIPNTISNLQNLQNLGNFQPTNTVSFRPTTGASDANTVVSDAGSSPRTVPVETTVQQTDPFSSSVTNTTLQDTFTNFGGFNFPSKSGGFGTRNMGTGESTRGATSQQATAFPASMFQVTGELTNPAARPQTLTVSQQTTFDPATGITFGSGFVRDARTFENIGSSSFGDRTSAGVDFTTDNSGGTNLDVTNFGNLFTSNLRTTDNSGIPTFTNNLGFTNFDAIFNSVQQTTDNARSGGSQSTEGALGTTLGSGFTSGQRSTGTSFPGFTTQQQTFTTPSGGFETTFGGRVTSAPGRQAIAPDSLACTDEYQKIPGHTLCMTDSPRVTRAGVSVDDKLRITQIHNNLRASVQPPAADLVMLHWDDRMAAVAQKWAKQCRLAHDTERKLPEMGMSVGQNVAVGFETWPEAIQMWYDEISLYRYGFEPDTYLGRDGWRQIAHFTQIVQNGTYLIGCGYAECPDTEYVRYYVCNYAAGQTDLAYPYTAGSRCEMCPANCNNGLCDCGGLVCLNGGRLEPSTCKCECPRPYSGDRCEIVDCPVSDNWICGRDWPPSYCDRFYNVPEECPYMCGICGDGSGLTPAVTTPNVTTYTSAFGCRYTGIRDDEATCRTYGENGSDMQMCASVGGTVGCGECDRYFNIKKDYCPVMCGLCEPPCGGKRCSNGGTLDTSTCSCTCRKPFTGDTCEFAQCPIKGDPGFCRFWPPRYCQMYYNVPEECPYMCGICKTDNISVSVRGRPKVADGASEQ